jgi:c-di-GMP-binding flagellar brake protein YcgR
MTADSREDRAPRQEAGGRGTTETPSERSVPLEEVKLAIGDAFQVQPQTDLAQSRYYVKLIGYLKGKSVLTTIPEADGKLCYLRDGQALVVRFFAGKNAYAFTANVLRSSSIPFPHMHLNYPSQVRGLVVRAGERAPVRIICAIDMPQETNNAAAGLMTNLSVGGALLATKTALGKKGTLLSIKFRLHVRGIEVLMAIDATVRSLSQDASGEFLQGIEFAGLPDSTAIALTAFVYQTLAEAAR